MARLFAGQKDKRENDVLRLLVSRPFGMRESDISSELGWDRRTTNNYLRTLRDRRLIYKEGYQWYIED